MLAGTKRFKNKTMNNTIFQQLKKAVVLGVILIILSANQTVVAEGSSQLNLAKTDIRTLIGVISKITGKNFIIDPRVKGGNVSVITNKKMTDDELYDTFLSVPSGSWVCRHRDRQYHQSSTCQYSQARNPPYY